MRMSAYDRWATQGPPDVEDEELEYWRLRRRGEELQEIELAKGPQNGGLCWCITWYEQGFTGACPDCRSTGNDLRGCDECHTEHDIRKCPEIRKELFR